MNIEEAVGDEAVTWFVMLRDDAATGEDRRRFEAWLAADPRHRQAWRDVEALWAGIDALPLARARRDGAAGMDHRRVRRGAWGGIAAVAASLVLAAVLAAAWMLLPPGFAAALLADHRTGTAEQRTVALPDGSSVVLGASSALSVDIDGDTRRVALLRGEGFFAVAPDLRRPFVVTAAGGEVTARGTSFDVKLAEGRASVAVATGTVEITAGTGRPVRLKPGRGARFGAGGVDRTRQVDVANIGSWREGRLIFEAAPLGEVLHDLERYRGGRILVTDGTLAARPVSGVFDARRPGPALDTIVQALGARMLNLADLLVVVRPAG